MFDDSNRPRIGLAAVITVVALVVWAVAQGGRGDDGTAEPAATAAVTAPVPTAINGVPLEDPAPPINATGTDPANTAGQPSRPRVESPEDTPVFMEGEAPSSTIGVPLIAVPEAPAVEPLRRSASFRSTISGFRTCLVQDLQSGLTVTITNLDNGRSVTCVTALAPANQIDEVVMHTRTFQQIADLTEAPIKVEVTR